ncbi:MAG: hypothetical protein EBQ56_00810 [Proteobacteria bacterium]|nr:hypothetical protein [Pseudomonadota bacterium]NBT02820.1 hypothetical protein [Pseudomonadota bacterium]NBT19625.1 hypothetical protein [Pseudomonadota bacterium]NBY46319.1 hypothetical protein [Pseudomonadota bacterium]
MHNDLAGRLASVVLIWKRSGYAMVQAVKCVQWRFRCAIPVATGGWHGQSGSFSSSDAICLNLDFFDPVAPGSVRMVRPQ